MNGRKLTSGVAHIAFLGVIATVAACAHAPGMQEEVSILDELGDQRSSLGPASCAALNATAVCEKSARLDDPIRRCHCVDPEAFSRGGKVFRF